MNRYSKYFLQNALWLDDGFCEYYLQDESWGRQEILDVESVIFNWPEEAQQWLSQCAGYDDFTTLRQLRTFLSDHCQEYFPLHNMNDRQVIRAAARQISLNTYQLVIKPKLGWAVQVDEQTAEPVQPIRTDPEPDLGSLLVEVKVELDALVVEQQKLYDKHEAAMAGMTPAEKAQYTSKHTGGAVYDTAIGDTIGLVSSAAKAAPGFFKGYLKTLWKVAQAPSKMSELTVKAISAGNMNPIKNEIDKIVDPIANGVDQALEYKSMVTILLSEPLTYEMLYDFSGRYWAATHPIERIKMGASAVTDVVVTVILAIVTVGVGAAVNVAAKSARLVKVAKLLKKIAAAIKKISPDSKMLNTGKNATGKAKDAKRASSAVNNKGVPKVETPKAVDKPDKKAYKDNTDKDGPKTTDPEKNKDYNRNDNNSDENRFDEEKDNRNSKFIPLKTTPLNSHYVGENIPNNPNNWLGGRSTVKYLNDSELEGYKLTHNHGKLYDAKGNPFDTSVSQTWDGQNKAIFVVNEKGDMFASTYQKVGEFHHSSLGQGKPVAMAGEIEVDNGILKSISNRSGHYTPEPEYLDQTISHLEQRGIDFNSVDIDVLEP